MKILVVAPSIMDYVQGQLTPIAMDATCECPPYEIYSLARILRNNGYEVVLADLIARGSNGMQPFLPDLQDCSLVRIGATTLLWPTARDVIKQIRCEIRCEGRCTDSGHYGRKVGNKGKRGRRGKET